MELIVWNYAFKRELIFAYRDDASTRPQPHMFSGYNE